MILYHGTNTNIEYIDLSMCRPYKDFGKGFYLTEIKDQAMKMAKRVSKIYGRSPVVIKYEFDESFLTNRGLNIRNFGKAPTEEWARFVMNNRNRTFSDAADPECNLDNKYDIVIGAVANDDIAMLFRQYQNELITFESLVGGITFRETTNQYSFHTEKALCSLKKAGVIYE